MDEKLIKLAVDGYHGHLGEYSVKDSQEVLRQAMIEANNGKTSMSYKDIRDGKCSNLFAITEVLIENVRTLRPFIHLLYNSCRVQSADAAR